VPNGPVKEQNTGNSDGKGQAEVEIDEDMELSEEQDENAASNYRMTRDDPTSSVVGSKNSVLNGKKI
jgi:hypothetical protein